MLPVLQGVMHLLDTIHNIRYTAFRYRTDKVQTR